MALHTEPPSSKAKREQALRNILSARRRQLLGSRVSDVSKSPSPKTRRPILGVVKDPLDMLEAQETRHGVYVTAPIGDQVSVIMDTDEEDPLELLNGRTLTAATSEIPGKSGTSPERVDDSTKNSLLIRVNDTDPWTLSETTTDESIASKNASQVFSRFQKIVDSENRRKNIVAMPESLYNHFRPVESNIPVEDMSQFLYFGQKLHPDIQNSSSRNNNSLNDVTSTSSSIASSRRRYSMKRFSTTTPIPMPRLEDIMNEEMNIALERGTVERNKIPKTKNVFRSPGSGTYFRKPSVRSLDPSFASNVIIAREMPRNSTALSDNKRENVLLRHSGKLAENSSAHAHRDQVAIVFDEGSNASSDSIVVAASAHRAINVETGNDSTQLHDDMAKKDESPGDNLSTTPPSDKLLKSADDKISGERFTITKTSNDESVSQSSIERDNSNMEMASTSRNELTNRITTWQSVDSNYESKRFLTHIESENESGMTSSTINDLTGQLDSKISSNVPTAATKLTSSSLRIVVTEPIGYAANTKKISSRKEEDKDEAGDEEAEEEEEEEQETEEINRKEASSPVDQAYLTNNDTAGTVYERPLELSQIPAATNVPRAIASNDDTTDSNLRELSLLHLSSPLSSTTMNPRHNTPLPPIDQAESAKTEKTEYKQQHAYAYEITNVTRLLRNYTGPGLNIAVDQQVKEDKRRKESGQADQAEKEEEKRKKTNNKKEKKLEDERAREKEREEASGEGERGKEVERVSALTRTSAGSIPEIRNVGGSVQPTPQRQPLPLLLLLPTPHEAASSSNSGGKVEPARTSVRLSAGTNVGEVTVSSGIADDGVVGNRSGGSVGGGGGVVVSVGSDIGRRNTTSTSFPTFATSGVGRASSEVLEDRASTTSLPKASQEAIREESTAGTIVDSTLSSNQTEQNGLQRPEVFLNDRRYLRKSSSPVVDLAAKEIKRRRGSSSIFTLPSNRRVKGWRNGANDEDTRFSVSKSMENRTVLPDDENALGERTEKISQVSESMTEMEVSANGTLERERIPQPGTTVLPPSTLESPLTEPTNTSASETVKSQPSVVKLSSEPGISSLTESIATSERTSERLTAVSRSESTLRSVEVDDSVDTTTTTSPPPKFPVTPRMLQEPSEKAIEDGTSSVDEKNTEINRPFGAVKDLDPSEIQKMYRSQTTLKPDLTVTTITPDLKTDDDSGFTTEEQLRTISIVDSSITRSPDVRGRNLSDKTKDKDDILPIMQLYNTSNIFNATGSDSSDSADVPRTSFQPPGFNESGLTTTTSFAAEIGQDSRSEKKIDTSNDDSSQPKKPSRHGVDRDYTNVHTTHVKSNITSHEHSHNSTQSNRTRQRPSYHQTPPTEFIGYRPEFNSSFFEPGMISVSSRESINISEVITKRHDGDTIATQETVAVVSYILATLVVFPIAVGVGLILRRLIIRNRKVLEESDTSSEISCRKDALNLENGGFKTSIEKAITKLPRIQHLCHEAEKPPPPASQESRWEFPRDKLRLQTVLGQGNFGQVWKAEADDLTGHQGTTRLVAVKTVKEGASAREKEDLVRELEIMQQLGNHPNVVTLLGCCTEEEPHYLILEYVMYGKLLAYLRDHRTRQDFYNFSEDSAALTSRDLTVFGYCVARGMEYLASKKIIHRDLAARNVLVDHNKLCKIADFGMSRFANEDGEVIEARHGRNALPIRWMAPESLIYSLFTTKTDVWSFGILMWEIVTLGSTPYPDMAAREVMRNVQNGYRLERPSHCRSELFRVISRCWHADPDRRPEFQTLRRDMAQLLEDSMNGHYVDLESFASECTD